MTDSYRLTMAVVLITYNQQDYVVEALEGIRSQSREPDEVVIADDGSSDRTQSLIREYVEKYNLNGWTLLLSPSNRGINENLAHAIINTTAEVIIGMAGDDISLPNRCQVTEDLFLKNQNISMIATSGLVIDESGVIIGKKIEPDGYVINDFTRLVKNGFTGHNPVGAALRREIFFNFPQLSKRVPNEDDQLSFRALLLGGIYCSSQITYKYRKHVHSISSWNSTRSKNKQEYADMLLSNLKIRAENYKIWIELCQLYRDNEGLEYIEKMIKSKIEFLVWLSEVDSATYFNRIKTVFLYRTVLCKRDFFYAITGKNGVIAWSRIRDMLEQIRSRCV